MTVREKVEETVRYLDLKYRRVPAADVAPIVDLKSGEIMDAIYAQLAKRPVGCYEQVSCYYPEFEDTDQDDITVVDDNYEALYDEFDKALADVLGDGGKWWWLIPKGDRLYDPDTLGLYFTDRPAPATDGGELQNVLDNMTPEEFDAHQE